MKRFKALHGSATLAALLVLGAGPSFAENTAVEGGQEAKEGVTIDEEGGEEPSPSKLPETNQPEATREALPEMAVELNPEIKEMQDIEPGFLPKEGDYRALQLFLLQKAVRENDDNLDKVGKEIKDVRAIFTKAFRERLLQYTEEKLGKREEQVNKSMLDLISSYETFLKHHPEDSDLTTEAKYFLGMYYYDVDERDYFHKLNEYNTARELGREDVPYPEENFSRTIDLYESIIARVNEGHPFRHIDGVYYLLALALWYEGIFDQAVEQFQALITKFPKSRYVEEVWFRLGEYYYNMDEFDDAIKAYAVVVKNQSSALYDKALYKMAWAYFQKDDYPNAIDAFVKVLALSTKEGPEGDATGMRDEVTRYIVKSMSEQLFLEKGIVKPKEKNAQEGNEVKEGKKAKKSDAEQEAIENMGLELAERVIRFVKSKKSPNYSRRLLIETASQLLDENKIRGAILCFETVMKMDPKSEDNPRIASQIIDILQEAGKLEEARQKNQRLIRMYGKGSAWFKANVNNYRAQKFALDAVRDAILSLAVYYHKLGKDLRDFNAQTPVTDDNEFMVALTPEQRNAQAASNFKKAASLYSRYLREYPERDDTPKAIFYFAEAAYELKRYKLALEAYSLLKEYPLPVPDNLRRDATFNIIFTFRHVLEAEAKAMRFREIDFDNLTSKSRGMEPAEIPAIGYKYLQAIDDFLRIAPHDEQVPVLLFHAAAIFYVYGHNDDAMKRFNFIIDTYPDSSAALVAGRLVVDDAAAQGNWTKVAELAKRFREQNLGGAKGDFARIEGNARFKIARAVFEEANELQKHMQFQEAKKKYKESAELYLKLLDEDPQNPYADVMLFNAAQAVMQSGRVPDALVQLRRLYTQYPQSEYAKQARFQEALSLEKILKFAEAAKAYDAIVRLDPAAESAGDAMLNKALLYEAAGDFKNATAAYLEFAKDYPHRPEAPDALLTVADIYKKQGKMIEQVDIISRFIKQYSKDKDKTPAIIEAHVRVGDVYGELAAKASNPATRKNYEKLQVDNYRSAVGLYGHAKESGLAAYYAAKARLFLEKPEQDEFARMRIDARVGKVQGEQLTKMMKRLAELSEKNEAIIRSYAIPVWNAEAMRRIGFLYEHLAAAMLKAPCPKDVASIDEYACEEYTVLLEDKASVLEDKALDAYKQAYTIAMSAYDAPDKLISDILKALSRLRPGEYQRLGDVIKEQKSLKDSELYGQTRMLSTGQMASMLRPNERDPDIAEVVVPGEEGTEKEKVEEEAAPAEEEEAPKEEDFEGLEELE